MNYIISYHIIWKKSRRDEVPYSRLSYNSYDRKFMGQKAYNRRFSGLKNKGELSYFFITLKALLRFFSFFGSVSGARILTYACKNYHRHSSVKRLNMMINVAFYNAYDSRFSCLESLRFQETCIESLRFQDSFDLVCMCQ